MTKLQGRIYFLYPFLLGISHYFFNVLTPFYKDIQIGGDNALLFFYVLIFSGVIALSIEKKNILAQIFSIAGSLIIFGLLLLISDKLEFSFFSLIISITFSAMVHVVCGLLYMLNFYFFEWFFEEKKGKRKPDYVEAE